jgi:hypothetical protein
MESRIGKYLLSCLPKVRRLKNEEDSVLAGLMDVFGFALDEAKDVIESLRRRACIWELDQDHTYYKGGDSTRKDDLKLHALDRGTRRLENETESALIVRLRIMPSTRQYMGSAMGMKYLVEQVLGHSLAGLVVYRDDPQGRIQLRTSDQGLYAEKNVSHVYSAADQADAQYDLYRQNRIYSEEDLDYRYQFWISIRHDEALSTAEKTRITELVNQEKPAHTVARVHFIIAEE